MTFTPHHQVVHVQSRISKLTFWPLALCQSERRWANTRNVSFVTLKSGQIMLLTQSIIPNSPVILSHHHLFVKNQILDKVDLPSCERPKRPEHCPSEIYNILVSLCWSHEPHQRARFSMLKKLVDEVSAILAYVLLSVAAFKYYTCLFWVSYLS